VVEECQSKYERHEVEWREKEEVIKRDLRIRISQDLKRRRGKGIEATFGL
jgi:hypothetical protein